MNALREALESGRTVVTAEVAPPKGTSLDEAREALRTMGPHVDAVNVTDGQSSVMRMASWALALVALEEGFHPVLQVTCRDRNRIALQADLLGAYALGVRSVLCLTGDHPSLGDHPGAMPVFDLDAAQLLLTVRELMEGRDLSGAPLAGGCPGFFPGAAVNPGATPLTPQLLSMERKVRAGARFFQTQAVYDPGLFEAFMAEARRFGVPVIAGVLVLKSPGMAKYLNEKVPGIQVPEALVREIAAAKSRRQKAVEIASRLVRELAPMCAGVHIMPLGWHDVVSQILEQSGVRSNV